ncbi:TraR/DksA family transcriptional regulator [Streptomyces sp. GSL17-111]|uniref:TraR/DksA family transcriptional regulator n=1 Tax=Streptomyces sp. GSL17-111 TaxID=3121596 RepID=UPI0030F4191C
MAGRAKKAAAGTTPAEGRPAARTADTGEPEDAPSGGAARKAARKAPAKKAAEKTAAKKTPAKKTSARKTAAKKTAAKKAAAKKTAATKASAGKTVAKRPAARAEPTKAAAKKAARKTGAGTVAAKKTTTGTQTAVPQARIAATPGELAVRAGEEPWTESEVVEARSELATEVERLRTEIEAAERALAGLMRDSGDGAGDDQADTGTKNITREHEMAVAENAREMMYQSERALERIAAGTYGLCENCGNPIGKARMQAFPRATLCVECKQKQERH